MVGVAINGTAMANDRRSGIKRAVFKLQENDVEPCLVTILVGENPTSLTYVKKKHDACKEVGIAAMDKRLRGDVTQEELNTTIKRLNADAMVHGILLQLPLPGHLNAAEAVSMISPDKDVDGLTEHSMGRLANGSARLIPCTPLGIMEILDEYKIGLAGKKTVVINRSGLIGKPLYHLLLQRDATVITCHSKTRDIAVLCRLADVVITAVGNRQIFELSPDMLKDGCTLIDAAISRYNGKLTGDADYDKVAVKTAYITPVPGGVGPMTVAMLLKNTIIAASDINGIEYK